MLRRIKGVTYEDKVRSDNIRREFGVCDILEKVREMRLQWFGHLERIEEDNPAKRGIKEMFLEREEGGDPDGDG